PAPQRRNAPWDDACEIRDASGRVAVTLYLGDCVEVMAALDPGSVDACVTDPPYELGFMGKAWDKAGGVASDPATWARVHALLKPGGHTVAFAGSRTYHRIASAIEAADFEIRDQLMWLYGSGFPKSHDISKCIDKRGGVHRGKAGAPIMGRDGKFLAGYARTTKGEAVFDDAKQWEGWGTALKPAHEPIALARKRFTGTVTDNVLAHGTGALNVDACRVAAEKLTGWGGKAAGGNTWDGSNCGLAKNGTATLSEGRWPANVITDGSLEVLEAFPASAREAIRFFYAPKADRAEREFGMDEAIRLTGEEIKGRKAGSAGSQTAASGIQNTPVANFHPTVKPIDLMAWLCRLVTPPGGTVLEPFMGSGSTGIAAVRHGFRFIGIEKSPEYFDIARRRIQAAVDAEAATPSFELEITRAVRAVQLGLFEQQHMARA
ncbi:MAG: site-specific DNA-methyltransferase, partial [Hyphomicrobiaceae bacterium]